MKICSKCGISKDLSGFYTDKGTKSGYKSNCKKCCRITQKEWEINNKEKRRKYRLKGAYGITVEEYNNLYTKQKGQCAICGSDKCITGRRLSVDHCHKTGKVRGLLCQLCNTAIGKFDDDIELLEAAIKYLKNMDNSDELQESDDKDLTSW